MVTSPSGFAPALNKEFLDIQATIECGFTLKRVRDMTKTHSQMNEIVNRFLLAGDKFMPEMHLSQPGFTCSACGPFTKNKERIQTFKETGDTSYIYKIEHDKACFQHDMAYGDFKDIKRRTASDKILTDKAFNIAKNPKYAGYQ